MKRSSPRILFLIGICFLLAGIASAGETAVSAGTADNAGIIKPVPANPEERPLRYGHITGIVYDRSGATVPGAVVEVEGTTAAGRPFYARTQTSRNGRFGFRQVPVGRYEVRAWKRGVGRDSTRIILREGEVERLRMVLR